MQTHPEAPTALVWELRLASLLPLSPLAMGVSLSAVLIAVLLSLHALSGFPIWIVDAAGDPSLGNAAHAQIVFALLLGYTVVAGRYLPVAIFRDLQESGRGDPSVDVERDELQILRYPVEVITRSRYAGCVGMLAGLALHVELNRRIIGDAAPWYPETIWALIVTALLGWLLARSAYFTVSGAGRAMRDPRIDAEIDLMDLRPHYVEGRIGLRLSLVWIVGSSIVSLLLLHPQVGLSIIPISMMVAGFAIAVAALVLPVRGVQQRIHRAKLAALANLDSELRRARDAALSGGERAGGPLADLLAYRSYIESVREWPFDNSTFARFGLYLLIPVGSWIGGAFVERVVSALLD